ncbi:MAG: MFS transporter [Candidatus Accumulibacter necessarius]|uniref:MFS transporter n=1 Tax=Candidatus Accumulibacter necessarius TaxID=2954386 RepID=UPI002FC28A66
MQLTLSVFLAGFACGQIFYGPLSDRFGRRPLMLGGLALFCAGSIGCVLATSIEMLVLARFVQALGACAGPVIGRAVVRDLWGASESARIIAYMGGAMAIAPLVGPTLGGFLTVLFGWQSNFLLLLLIGALQLVAVACMLSESNVHRDPAASNPRQMVANFARLLADRHYLAACSASPFPTARCSPSSRLRHSCSRIATG